MNSEPTKQHDVTLTDEVQTTEVQQPAQDDNDFPLGKACDLSGEGDCEACQ